MGMLILPRTGRGTIAPAMVEGAASIGLAQPLSPSTVRWRDRSPSPQAGRIW